MVLVLILTLMLFNHDYGKDRATCGPLLFLLYVNDFSRCSIILDIHLFADDSKLFFANRSLLEIESVINAELKLVNSWLCYNILS